MQENIYAKVNNENELRELNILLNNLKFKCILDNADKKLFPIAIEKRNMVAYTITSPSICSCLFINAKKKLLSLNELKNTIKEKK